MLDPLELAGSFTRDAIQKLEKATGKKVVTHHNMKELNSPEIQKELIQSSMPKELEEPELSDFNKKLKQAIEKKGGKNV